MIGRVILAALLAGIAAGLCMGVLQQVRLTPLILEAEKYEMADLGHDHEASADGSSVNHAAMHHAATADDAETGSWRTPLTFASTAVAGAGFAAVLCGVSFLAAIPITRQNGFVWGMAGFAAFVLSPAAGLPPELPGMPVADLGSRQLWWIATALCTAAAFWFMYRYHQLWAIAASAFLILLPHIFGAPAPEAHDTTLPAEILGRFVANSIAANGLFWLLIGTFLGVALPAHEDFKEI